MLSTFCAIFTIILLTRCEGGSSRNPIAVDLTEQLSNWPDHNENDLDSSFSAVVLEDTTQYSGDEPNDIIGEAVVEVLQGELVGVAYPESQAFYQVPYAKPPLGDLRFKPPLPADNFTGTFDATTNTNIACEQVKQECDGGDCDSNPTEDCLVLNIFVPSSVNLTNGTMPPEASLPVFFWIHGGFFYKGAGTSPIYNGRWLSNSTDSIVVSINFRLGAFGFLTIDEENEFIAGNQGLQDQRLAMQWVYDNIAMFGGNKSKVTIFGESSGAQAVMFHLVSQESSPLFSRAIMQSNPAVFQYPTPTEALDYTTSLKKIVSCSDVACLRSKSAKVIAAATPEVIRQALKVDDVWGTIEPYRPVIDSVEFRKQPLKLFQNGKWLTDKEIIIGTNHQEMIYAITKLGDTPVNKTQFEAFNRLMLGNSTAELVNAQYENVYASKYNYTTILAAELTDLFFTCPTRSLARFASETADKPSVYLYDNAYANGGQGCEDVYVNNDICGYSFHYGEIVFVFGSGPSFGETFTSDDELITSMFGEYWGNFAHTGNPSRGQSFVFEEWPAYELQLDNKNLPHWPNIYIQAPQSRVELDYRKFFCDFWDSTAFYTATPPDHTISWTQTTQTTSGSPRAVISLKSVVLAMVTTWWLQSTFSFRI